MTALAHVSVVLSWHEHLEERDLPPHWMWHLTEELEDHFDRVKANRGLSRDDRDDDGGPMLRNEYARDRGPNAR